MRKAGLHPAVRNDATNLDGRLPPPTLLSICTVDKSLRWLALVASQRLQLMQPKGRQRMREAGDARRGFALPKAVISKVRPDPKKLSSAAATTKDKYN